ncbi:hypothetical protein EIN_022410 [Entamoeba invadens IP1]|uniref:hypothetical protein n=1 Tax=Entamoeba invadens IP1 TaxID=370355 RepID=UPI0002C3DB31|nr:hypothetical protein EIN_022410 [Entamoeba invadens IP1]ELP90632.1 hypothetical protein EIN_022410 [Entamoeba invadens IP1]|eukprot:XP_004257403.1 hypothetical protein EIN_022410 [Entamoeba invadens IP1]
MNWDISSESIDDEDDYVIKICEMINNQFGVIKANIFKKYYMRICHVTVNMIIDEMFETIFKCKKISVEGAQKMQMGYSQIKSSLQKSPTIEVQSCKETGNREDVLSETDYAMQVKKLFLVIENTLKVLQCENKDTAFALYQQPNPNQSDELFISIKQYYLYIITVSFILF